MIQGREFAFGAVLGVFLAGFVFIPSLGLLNCTLLAAALNLAIAMLILLIDRGQAELDVAARNAMDSAEPDDSPVEIHPGLLAFLFAGNQALPCLDAADTDDSGKLDIADAIWTFNWLFAGDAAPADPGPDDCGNDPTANDSLDCAAFGACPPSADG